MAEAPERVTETAARRRRTAYGVNTALAVLLLLAIVALVEALSYSHNRRFDLTEGKRQSLSDQSVKVLRGLAKPVKAVLTGPYTLARLSVDQHYGSVEGLALAFAEALNQEAKALQAAGASLIQFNEPAILQHKDDFPDFANVCRHLADGLTAETALYLYFGDVDGIYPQILDLPFALIGLDFCTGARNEQVLHRSPFTKKLGLGIVDARNTRLESPEQILERIRALSAGLPPDHIHVSPNMGLEFLPREVAQEKLRRLAQAVREAEAVLV